MPFSCKSLRKSTAIHLKIIFENNYSIYNSRQNQIICCHPNGCLTKNQTAAMETSFSKSSTVFKPSTLIWEIASAHTKWRVQKALNVKN